MTRDFVAGCLNRNIFILAEVDARVSGTKHVEFDAFVPRQGYGPVSLVMTIVPTTPSATCSTTLSSLIVPPAIVSGFLWFLPAIVTGHVTLPFLETTSSISPIILTVSIRCFTILIIVASVSRTNLHFNTTARVRKKENNYRPCVKTGEIALSLAVVATTTAVIISSASVVVSITFVVAARLSLYFITQMRRHVPAAATIATLQVQTSKLGKKIINQSFFSIFLKKSNDEKYIFRSDKNHNVY